MTLKFIWKGKGPKMAKTTLKKENKFGWFTLFNFKTNYKAMVSNQGGIDVRIDKEIENPEINSHIINWFSIKSLEKLIKEINGDRKTE